MHKSVDERTPVWSRCHPQVLTATRCPRSQDDGAHRDVDEVFPGSPSVRCVSRVPTLDPCCTTWQGCCRMDRHVGIAMGMLRRDRCGLPAFTVVDGAATRMNLRQISGILDDTTEAMFESETVVCVVAPVPYGGEADAHGHSAVALTSNGRLLLCGDAFVEPVRIDTRRVHTDDGQLCLSLIDGRSKELHLAAAEATLLWSVYETLDLDEPDACRPPGWFIDPLDLDSAEWWFDGQQWVGPPRPPPREVVGWCSTCQEAFRGRFCPTCSTLLEHPTVGELPPKELRDETAQRRTEQPTPRAAHRSKSRRPGVLAAAMVVALAAVALGSSYFDRDGDSAADTPAATASVGTDSNDESASGESADEDDGETADEDERRRVGGSATAHEREFVEWIRSRVRGSDSLSDDEIVARGRRVCSEAANFDTAEEFTLALTAATWAMDLDVQESVDVAVGSIRALCPSYRHLIE